MASMQVQKETTLDDHFNSAKQWQNGTVATMHNQTRSSMSLDRYMNWSGIPAATGSFPSTIPANGAANFTHLRDGHFGSVGGVQYSGFNATGMKCAWIVAWQAPVENDPPLPPNRVYVTCGPKTVMDAMTWHQILMKLDTSPTDDSESDSSAKISVDAHIHDDIPNSATLLVNFNLIP
ncbi:jasmonate-induced protein homolog [Silene latifolia]|uniref:jasmonate-induced protein homolog n=1 Tax=Silene latifolia TaxID=37657 RepID=UPI003D76EFBB